MRYEKEDSTGKSKITEAKARYKVLISFFLVGLCIGMVIAERLYVQNSQMARPRVLVRQIEQTIEHQTIGRLHMHSGGSGAAAATAAPAPQKPRNELEALLQKVAPQKELLVAVANKNTLWDGMLDTFCKGIKRTGVANHLILALDPETKKWCEDNGLNAYLMSLEIARAQQGTGDNHAVSAMKFGILKHFIELGYAVLLSDVDIVILQNPFNHLYRDSDVEGMTDGFDDRTAYGHIDGFDDPTMGWGRYAQLYKHFNMNSGLFYLSANNRTMNLLTRLADRLSKTKYWDQTAYNEEIFFLSHGSYKSPQVTRGHGSTRGRPRPEGCARLKGVLACMRQRVAMLGLHQDRHALL